MSSQQDIIEIFSILHDGSIESWTGDKNHLVLKVGCLYLAELINKDFEYFFIEIKGIKEISLLPFWNDFEREKELFTELEDIFQAELDINSASEEGGNAVIFCHQFDESYHFSSGLLTLNCLSIKVYNQDKSELTIDEFGEICRQYWDKFGKR